MTVAARNAGAVLVKALAAAVVVVVPAAAAAAVHLVKASVRVKVRARASVKVRRARRPALSQRRLTLRVGALLINHLAINRGAQCAAAA